MKTIEFTVQSIKGEDRYSARHSPKLGPILQRSDINFAGLLLNTLTALSEYNRSREPVLVRLPSNLPNRFKKWAKNSFMDYAGNRGVTVLYSDNGTESKMLRPYEL